MNLTTKDHDILNQCLLPACTWDYKNRGTNMATILPSGVLFEFVELADNQTIFKLNHILFAVPNSAGESWGDDFIGESQDMYEVYTATRATTIYLKVDRKPKSVELEEINNDESSWEGSEWTDWDHKSESWG